MKLKERKFAFVPSPVSPKNAPPPFNAMARKVNANIMPSKR